MKDQIHSTMMMMNTNTMKLMMTMTIMMKTMTTMMKVILNQSNMILCTLTLQAEQVCWAHLLASPPFHALI